MDLITTSLARMAFVLGIISIVALYYYHRPNDSQNVEVTDISQGIADLDICHAGYESEKAAYGRCKRFLESGLFFPSKQQVCIDVSMTELHCIHERSLRVISDNIETHFPTFSYFTYLEQLKD